MLENNEEEEINTNNNNNNINQLIQSKEEDKHTIEVEDKQTFSNNTNTNTLKVEDKNLNKEKKGGFERIYSAIQIIKDKHKESQSQSKVNFSLDNYQIEKVFKSRKLKEIFSLVEPNMGNKILNQRLTSTLLANSATQNNKLFSQFMNVINDNHSSNNFNRNNYRAKKPNDLYKSQNVSAKNYDNLVKPNHNRISFYKTFTGKVGKYVMNKNLVTRRNLLNYNENNSNSDNRMNFKFQKTWDLQCIKKYNKNYYKEKMKDFDMKLSRISKMSNDPTERNNRLFLFRRVNNFKNSF